VLMDPHSPGEFRVDGVLQNMPEICSGVLLFGGAADGFGQRLPRMVSQL